MKTLAALLLISSSCTASAITPLSDKEYADEVNAFQRMPHGACEATQDGFDTFLEYFVRNHKLAAQYTNSTATQPFYLGLRDYTWVYGSEDNEFENPSAVLTQTFLASDQTQVRVVIQKAEYDAEYNVVRTWGPTPSYDFAFSPSTCWRRIL